MSQKLSLTKNHTFVIALVVIVGFLIFYGIALVNACIIKSDTNGIQLVASTLGPIVASIIGYYFGQRQIRPMAEEAKIARDEKENYRKFSDDTFEQFKDFEIRIANLEKENNIKDDLIKNKDDLINTLKNQNGV